MLYVNKLETKAKIKTYDELVDLVVSSGVEPKRAYIYLAGLGVHGELARLISDSEVDYERPVKVGVTADGHFVTKAEVCGNCGGIKIN